MGDKLTTQDKGFVEDLIKTGNATQAVKDNYDIENDNYARVKAHRLITKDNIKKAIADALPDSLLEEVHLEGLRAVTGKGDDVQIDYSVRHKYLDTAYKLKGSYAPDKAINLNIDTEITNPQARELAQEYEERLKKSL